MEKKVTPTKPKTAPNLPLVRESRAVTGHGILSARQKLWASGKPNEGYIENPVHYKLVISLFQLVGFNSIFPVYWQSLGLNQRIFNRPLS